jgi:hypothetical protein
VNGVDQKAELYNNPGARFVGTGKLADVLAQYDKLGAADKPNHFIIYGDKSYTGAEIDGLRKL